MTCHWKKHNHTTHTHTHPSNGPFSGTTQVSRYQKGKTSLDFTEARDSEWQWHQPGRMQVYTSLQTNNHASTHHSVFYRPDALPAAQPTASKHWRHQHWRHQLEKYLNLNLANFFKFCICWQFWSKHLYTCHQYLETVRCIWFHFCLLTYLIKILTAYSTLQCHIAVSFLNVHV